MSSKSAAAAADADEEAAALLMDMDCMADLAPFVESDEEACLGALDFVSKTMPEIQELALGCENLFLTLPGCCLATTDNFASTLPRYSPYLDYIRA